MKTRSQLLTGAAIAALVTIFADPAFSKDVLLGPIPAKLLEVRDGDTIKVRANIWLGQEVEVAVRLDGIDTPEKGGRAKCDRERNLALAATEFLTDFLGEGPVHLREVQNGKYAGRVVAKVFNADQEDAAQAIIERGYAVPYHGGKRKSWCGAN